ncbi:MAG: hypothetical protein C5B50_20290 [Verrucomicrobia bacterium]|nr:MAG: hypothetical protein C5B50_20290 [Verrucomicrobiota bacterium]
MDSTLNFLRALGPTALRSFIWPMLWQSSLLIALLFGMDLVLRRKVAPGVRYWFWLLVLLKLLLPPSLALPTSVAWWVRPSAGPSVILHQTAATLSYGPANEFDPSSISSAHAAAVSPPVPASAWIILVWPAVSLGLFARLAFRFRQVGRLTKAARPPNRELREILDQAQDCVRLQRQVELRLTDAVLSPAVCGLFRPVLLLPRNLAEHLTSAQLRAVLCHELMHLRRKDILINWLQTLLQVVYWWHPLLWLANVHIRRLREEAVDDSVRLALRHEADNYPAALLEVAKLALARPIISLCVVGILESNHSLSQRIERLLEPRQPLKAGLTLVSVVCFLAFATIAVPMGQAPPPHLSAIASPGIGVSAEPRSNTNVGLLWRGYYDRPDMLEHEVEKRRKDDQKMLQAFKAAGYNLPESVVDEMVDEEIRKEFRDRRTMIRMLNEQGITFATFRQRKLDNFIETAMRANLSHEVILQKLKTIHVDRLSFVGVPLSEVAQQLTELSKQGDPEGRGINFRVQWGTSSTSEPTIDPATGLPSSINSPTAPTLDPFTGLPKEFTSVDANAVSISIQPALVGASLLQVLNAIVEVAEPPLRYSIDDSGVVFSLRRADELAALQFRTIRVNPGSFKECLAKMAGIDPAQMRDPIQFHSAMTNFTSSLGVDTQPPKTIFFNQTEGTLVIRATKKEIDRIEQGVSALNVGQPLVLLRSKFVEAPDDVAASLWAALPESDSVPRDQTRVLSEEQAGRALKTLESSPGTTILSEGKVTTQSGRRSQMQCVLMQTIVTNVDPRALKPPGVPATGGVPYLATNMPVGPTIDLAPMLRFLPEGNQIYLMGGAEMTEFLGYDQPASTTPVYIGGKEEHVLLPLPHFRYHQMRFQASLLPGQTLLLGEPFDQKGQSAKASNESKQLLVFVTATILNDKAPNDH